VNDWTPIDESLALDLDKHLRRKRLLTGLAVWYVGFAPEEIREVRLRLPRSCIDPPVMEVDLVDTDWEPDYTIDRWNREAMMRVREIRDLELGLEPILTPVKPAGLEREE
jgi:hypothetical protein